MKPTRLAIITSRYWPQVGEAEVLAAELAGGLVDLGVRPTIVTGKWSAEWPTEMRVREIDIVRVPHAPRGGWSTFRYMIDLARWLRLHRKSLDAVVVIGMRQEAFVAVDVLRGRGVPLVLCCHESGPAGDCAWHAATRFGEQMRQRCRLADGIVASNAAAEELRQNGFEGARIQVTPGGVAPADPRSADRRFRARAALADANFDLAVAEYAPVMVFAGRLVDLNSLTQMIRDWREVARCWPSARFWLIGDGPARDPLYEQLATWDLREQVFLPGTFVDLTDIWRAADVFVVPPRHTGQQMALDAMAAGLPVIAPDCTAMREIVQHRRNGLLVPVDDREAWQAALVQLCEQPAIAAELGNEAQRLAVQHFPRHKLAEHHLVLVASRPGGS